MLLLTLFFCGFISGGFLCSSSGETVGSSPLWGPVAAEVSWPVWPTGRSRFTRDPEHPPKSISVLGLSGDGAMMHTSDSYNQRKSLFNTMNRFIGAINNMDQTVMVPSLLRMGGGTRGWAGRRTTTWRSSFIFTWTDSMRFCPDSHAKPTR